MPDLPRFAKTADSSYLKAYPPISSQLPVFAATIHANPFPALEIAMKPTLVLLLAILPLAAHARSLTVDATNLPPG